MRIWINITIIYFVTANPLKALDTHFKLNFNNSLENYAIRVLLDFASKVSLSSKCLDQILACYGSLNARNFEIFIFKPKLAFLRKNHKNDN